MKNNGLVVDKAVNIEGSLVKTSASTNGVISALKDLPTPVSLLESIASDHYKNLDPDLGEILKFSNGIANPLTFDLDAMSDSSNPLSDLANIALKTSNMSVNTDSVIKIPSTVSNPLMLMANPLAASSSLGYGGMSEHQSQTSSSPINIPATSSLSGLHLSSANPLHSATSLDQSSLVRDHSPSAMSKNPLLGNGGIKSNGIFCGNPLLAVQNPLSISSMSPKLPLISPNNNISNGVVGNPLLSKLAKMPILNVPKMMESFLKSYEEQASNNFGKEEKMEIKKPPPPSIVPLTLAQPPPTKIITSQSLMSRYKPKPKPEYEHGIVMTNRKQRLCEPISSFPVPFDDGLYDRSLVKDKPSAMGLRFGRRNNESQNKASYYVNKNDENALPFQKVWFAMGEILPEKIFKFDTPSPDALVGTAIEFVGMRPNTTEELLNISTPDINDNSTGSGMDFTRDSDFETKVFPGVGPKQNSRRPAATAVKREKKKVANHNNINTSSNNNVKIKKSRSKPSEKSRSRKK